MIHVRNHTVDGFARGMRVDIRKGERLDFSDGVTANIPYDGVGDAVVQNAHDPLKQRGCRDNQSAAPKQTADRFKIDRAALDAEINGVSDQNREIERHGYDKDGEDQGKNQFWYAASHITERFADRFFIAHHSSLQTAIRRFPGTLRSAAEALRDGRFRPPCRRLGR